MKHINSFCHIGKSAISVSLAVLLVLSVCIYSVVPSCADNSGNRTENIDLSKLKSYYSENLDKADPEKADMDKYWSIDNGVLTRVNSSNNGGEINDVAVLYYDAAKYKDFTLDVDYYRELPEAGGAFIGFDGEPGKAWRNYQQGTMLWDFAGYGRIRGSTSSDGYISNGGWGNGIRISDYKAKKWRHFRIDMKGSNLRAWIDGTLVLNVTNFGNWYDGGCIYLASNIGNSAFKNLKITDNSVKPEIKNGFVSYYSESLNSSVPKVSGFDDYWKFGDDNTITRINAKNVGGEFDDMAILYYSVEQYKDFVLEAEYKHENANGKYNVYNAFVGFDGVLGKSWKDKNSGTMLWEYAGYGRSRGSVGEDGAVRDKWGNKARLPEFESDSWHSLKLEVSKNEITFTVDNIVLYKTSDLGAWYDGGYIFLASNGNGTTFRNFKVRKTDADFTNDFSSYDSYYTDFVGKDALAKAEATDYWTELNGKIVRKSEVFENSGGSWNLSNYHLGHMAFLFLDGDYTKYRNFSLDMDYTMGSGAWGRTYIGFGAAEDKSWCEENGGVMFFTDSGGSTGFEGNINTNGKTQRNVFGVKIDGFNSTVSHHLRLVCTGGIITVFLDGREIKTFIQNSYMVGGKFFLASNSTGATYENITIKEIPSGGSSFDGYDEWFGENIKSGSLTDVVEGTYWTSYDGVITRKTVDVSKDVKNNLDMGYLYLNEREYKNFTLELDFKHGISGWSRAGVGFGAKLGKDFFDLDGGITAFTQPDGYLHIDGNIITNGKFNEKVFWATYDDDGNDLTTIRPYDRSEWHHMKLTVLDGFVSVIIDNFDYIFEIDIPADYNGGYIYLFSNSSAAQYKNITVEDLTVEIDPDQQAAWTPEDSDLQFNFKRVDYSFKPFEWKFKNILLK